MRAVSVVLCVGVAVVLQGCGSGAGTSTTSLTTTTSSTSTTPLSGSTTTPSSTSSTTSTSLPEWALNGIDCPGGDLDQVLADTAEACYDLCLARADCNAFSHLHGDCWLKKSCPNLKKDWANPEKTSGTMPSMKIRRGWFELEGYKCSGQKDTVLFYPEGKGPFRVVAFGHGLNGEIDGADDWLQTIASHGFIVVAPFTGMPADKHATCWSTFSEDIVHALQGSKAGGASLHPVFGKADWSRTGIVGHSRGAVWSSLAVSEAPKDLGVSAMVMDADAPPTVCDSCPSTPEQQEANKCTCDQHVDLDTPAMMTVGSKDHGSADRPANMHKFFEAYKAPTKVFADLKGGLHQEITHKKRLNKFHANFLSCHVNEKEEDCELIYGKGPESLCQAHEYSNKQGPGCVAQRAESSIIV